MDAVVYWLARLLVNGLQALPLPAVARLGRAAGSVAYWLDVPHRQAALENLTRCFRGEKSAREIRAVAKEHFRRLGENYACAVKTASMPWAELRRYVEFANTEEIGRTPSGVARPCIVAIGHFGNFELYARFGEVAQHVRCATTYRALNQPRLNQLLQSIRARSGCLYFERRTDANALKQAFAGHPPLLLGLLADQHAGQRGVRVPFFQHDCSTTPAPAIFALRYRCSLYTAVCYRTGLGRWRIEAGDLIATMEDGHPRPIEAITRDINLAFEHAVRRDPANWFWVHRRWKPARKPTSAKAATQNLSAPRASDPALPRS